MFASTENVREVKDLTYGLELRIQELEARLEKQDAIINALCEKVERWSALKRIV